MFGPKLVHHHPEEGTRLARVKPDRGTSRTSLPSASDPVSIDPAHGGRGHLTTPTLPHPRPVHPLPSCSSPLHRSCLWWLAPPHCALAAVTPTSSPSASWAATTIVGPGPLTLLSPYGTSPQSPPLSGTWAILATPACRSPCRPHEPLLPPPDCHPLLAVRPPPNCFPAPLSTGSNPHSALPYP